MPNKKSAITKFFDLQTPFFIPVWRRVVVVVICVAWAGVEFMNGAPLWAAFFVAIAAFCAYQFFIVFNPDTGED